MACPVCGYDERLMLHDIMTEGLPVCPNTTSAEYFHDDPFLQLRQTITYYPNIKESM